MGIIPSRNLEEQRREKNGIVYFDRGTLTGKNGRRYDRFAIQTHFVEVGEDQEELVRRYVLPLYREGDVLSVRGYGKAIYDGIDHETRKNRYQVSLRKLV